MANRVSTELGEGQFMSQEAKAGRDSFIDLVRGLCALSVVFIHTVFWSGSEYVPTYLRSLSLLFDVPVFFFLSGMAFSTASKLIVITGIFRLSIVFGLLALIYDVLFSGFNFQETYRAFTLSPPQLRHLPVVTASYWFVPVYVVVSICAAVILEKMKNIYIPLMVVLFSYYPYFYFLQIDQPAWSILGVSGNFLIFYLFIYLLGYAAKQHIVHGAFKQRLAIALFFIGGGFLCLAYTTNGIPALDLQSAKFPIGLPYVAASLLSIAVIMYSHNGVSRIKWLEHIGRNAIFYYAGQGVGASILLKIVGKINFDLWQTKLLVMFILNLIITVVVSEGLRSVYRIAGMSSKCLLSHMNWPISADKRSST
ncbi:MAG: acyltransferase [Nitrospirota bacterium]